jgi:putative toxin-antitoxin system antitoxin component (TIGR02293 family)
MKKEKPLKKSYYSNEEKASVIEEAAVQYETLRAILGGNKSIGKPIEGEIDLIGLSRSGIRKSSLKSLSGYLGITMDEMSSLLHTSHRTIQRKEDDELLDVFKSEQAIELAQIVGKGIEVFGSKDNFQQWLHSGLIALSGKKPIDFLDTSFGIRMLYRLLGRIEHGVYS